MMSLDEIIEKLDDAYLDRNSVEIIFRRGLIDKCIESLEALRDKQKVSRCFGISDQYLKDYYKRLENENDTE